MVASTTEPPVEAASAAEPPEAAEVSASAPLNGLVPIIELSACPATAKEAIYELSDFPAVESR